jgi:Caspase domain
LSALNQGIVKLAHLCCPYARKRRARNCPSTILLGLLLLCLSMLHAQTLRYRALLVGNDDYVNFPKLNGAPLKDVNAMYQVLISLGMEKGNITVVTDLNYSDFLKTLSDFVAPLHDDDAVLFYYSGHGFSIDGDDYLAPVDFPFLSTKDIAERNSIRVESVANAYLARIKSRVIILDACRTDAQLSKQMINQAPKIILEPLISSRSAGSLIAYSTSARKASNALSQSGLSFYTQYLVNSLAARPRDMLTALNDAKNATATNSNQGQVPAIYNEMEGSFSFVNGTTSYLSRVEQPPANIVRPADNSCQLIRQAIASGQRGFTDLIGTSDRYWINSTLNLPGALFTTVTPNRYLSGNIGSFKDHQDVPSAEVTAAYYKALDPYSACLKSWKARSETYYTNRLGIRFESDSNFVVYVHCDEENQASDDSGHKCSINLYPPDRSGMRSADLPKMDFKTLLKEMVDNARNNFVEYGATSSGRDWKPLDDLPGAKCRGYFDDSRRASVQCDEPRNCLGDDCQFDLKSAIEDVQLTLGTAWLRNASTSTADSEVHFRDSGGTREVIVSIWKPQSAQSTDTNASGIRITISKL